MTEKSKVDTIPYRVKPEDDFLLSVSKLAGKPVKDVHVYATTEGWQGFGIEFEDGSSASLDGSGHDNVWVLPGKTAPFLVEADEASGMFEDEYETYWGTGEDDGA